MPYATNPVDGVRTYFEDAERASPPVLFYTGFADPLEVAKSSRLARALSGGFRLVFADHRGQGASDKPRQASAYALPTRVADAVAVLDALGIERAHFLGSSWGAPRSRASSTARVWDPRGWRPYPREATVSRLSLEAQLDLFAPVLRRR